MTPTERPSGGGPPQRDAGSLLEFMYRLGQALLASVEQTATVELYLRRIAAANGARSARVVAFPTAIFISIHDGEHERVTLAEGPTQTLRLDQIGAVSELCAEAQKGAIEPQAGLERLEAILKKPPRFGPAVVVLGHLVLTVGLATVLMPTPSNLATAAVLGAIVGALKVLNRNRPVLAVPLPVVAAALVSTLVFLAVKHGLAVDPLYALVPPLVTFLPGGMLTLGMVELAYGDMVSGSSRIITGMVQLVLLTFGLGAGALLVGYRPTNLVDAAEKFVVPAWSAWLGVVVFGTGIFLHFTAPRNSYGWLMLALLATFAAQQFGSSLLNYKEAGGFFGMLVATPLVYFIQLRFKGPPAAVTFLPCFWLLAPGVLSLLSLKHMLSDRMAGLEGIISAVSALAAIALGSLMGASFYKWVSETFGGWRLQLGRVGRRFRNEPDQ